MRGGSEGGGAILTNKVNVYPWDGVQSELTAFALWWARVKTAGS